MSQYRVLNNFPQDVIDDIKAYWDQHKDVLKVQQPGDLKRREVMGALDSVLEKLNLNPSGIVYLSSEANVGLTQPHIDRRRLAVINIPMDVDPEKSFFYIDKKNREFSWEDPQEYIPEDYDHYNLEKPCVFNAKAGHGYANFMDRDRSLASIFFQKISYEELIKVIPKGWS